MIYMKTILRIAIMSAVLLIPYLGTWAAGRGHILYTSDRIAKAKERMAADKVWADAWQTIKSRADKSVTNPDVRNSEQLALTFLMTGEDKYADAMKTALLKAAKTKTWGSDEMLARKPVWRADLGLASRTLGAAIAYDAIRERLTAAERKEIAEGLYRVALEPSLGDWINESTRIHSLNSMGHNWWTSCVCMGGILAIALDRDLPQARQWAEDVAKAVPQWFDFGGDVLQNKPRSFDLNGGMYESVNYANFGCEEALMFMLAYRNAYPKSRMADIPQLQTLANFFITVCYPRTGMLYSLPFGDSHLNITASNTMVLLEALGLGNSNIRWYLSQLQNKQDRDGYWPDRAIGFLYTPVLRGAPAVPDVSPSQLFADMGWGVMRSSWKRNATMLAVKCGYTWNHSHADASSFVLFHNGVDIIKDGGHCWYPSPAYRNYFFQSEAHNVVLCDGKAQPRHQQYHGAMLRGYLHYMMDGGDFRYLLANATGPTSSVFSRNFRHFLWIDKVIYVVDDLESHEPGEYQWLWHQNGEVRKHNGDVTITNNSSSVVIRPLYPRMLALSDFVHDYPEDLWMEKVECPSENLKDTDSYYAFHLPGKHSRIKALNAIMLKDNPQDNDMPKMERREGKDWIGVRIKYHGTITDLYINQLADGRLMHSNSWIEADGWTTDAYMFAVRYREGQKPSAAKDLFVCYGSALRRDKVSYFSSLQKLYLIKCAGKTIVEGTDNPVYKI